MEALVDRVLEIKSADEKVRLDDGLLANFYEIQGVQQILCDIEYLINVFSAMEMDPVDRLQWLKEFLEADLDDLGKQQWVGGKGEVKAKVQKLRGNSK